jgi:sensor domain CHASE-containing protein
LAAIEFLKSQFSSLTTSFNIYVGLLSAVTVLFVGVAVWLFKRTLNEAKQEVDQLVKVEVRREIARSIKSRVDFLEQVLQREEVPSLITLDYVLQNTAGTLPKEYRLLSARFAKLKIKRLVDCQL